MFDVVIRPWVVDESSFVRDVDRYTVATRPIVKADNSRRLFRRYLNEFVQYKLFDVLSHHPNPISEVENSKAVS